MVPAESLQWWVEFLFSCEPQDLVQGHLVGEVATRLEPNAESSPAPHIRVLGESHLSRPSPLSGIFVEDEQPFHGSCQAHNVSLCTGVTRASTLVSNFAHVRGAHGKSEADVCIPHTPVFCGTIPQLYAGCSGFSVLVAPLDTFIFWWLKIFRIKREMLMKIRIKIIATGM